MRPFSPPTSWVDSPRWNQAETAGANTVPARTSTTIAPTIVCRARRRLVIRLTIAQANPTSIAMSAVRVCVIISTTTAVPPMNHAVRARIAPLNSSTNEMPARTAA